jgi:hypothetical protein
MNIVLSRRYPLLDDGGFFFNMQNSLAKNRNIENGSRICYTKPMKEMDL